MEWAYRFNVTVGFLCPKISDSVFISIPHSKWTEEHKVTERKRFILDNDVACFNFNYGIKELLELIYRRNLQSTVYDAFYDVMMPQYGTNAFECYESRFYSYALFGLLDEWIKRGFYETVEQMVENVNRICERHQ